MSDQRGTGGPGDRALDPTVVPFLHRLADELGTDPPSEAEIDDLLALAGDAARASARQAAPVACWLASRAGVSAADARNAVARAAT